MHIVIPMSGIGKRFIDAGYNVPKFLIEIDGKPVIQHVIELFPGADKFTFICNKEHIETTNIEQTLLKIEPNSNIVKIEPHKLGPVHAVLQASNFIEDDEEVIVSYCDFGTYWDYSDFLEHTRNRNADGAVPAYKGFHPHMLGTTNYAFMRDEKQWMLEIQEKKPFTSNRMQEYASNGIYYFKKGSYIKKYFSQLIEKGIDLNGEYYISLIYNLLKNDGLDISIYEIQHMLQWGTPADVEEYEQWSSYFTTQQYFSSRAKISFVDNLIMPMSGLGSRFSSSGYKQPKPLLDVNQSPMYKFAIDSCPTYEKLSVAVLNQHDREFSIAQEVMKNTPNANVQILESVTEGQAETCSLLISDVPDNESIFITACDSGFVWDEDKFTSLIENEGAEVVVFVFKNHPHANLNPNQYGWVDINENEFNRVSVKTPLSNDVKNDFGVIGSFYFSESQIYKDAYKKLVEKNDRVNNEFYVDSLINYVDAKIKVLEVDFYICLGTPNDYETFIYWQSYHHKNPNNIYSIEKDNNFKDKLVASEFYKFKQEYS
ncbi:NTP transferase domain-containing protein [Photobacterium chitinilyticum]|uniref:NTP transferase domain-containing protein n=1 Tax=Photobacterium chitinilyticum TaxID=2485123 RepID=UPI003D100626